MSRKEFRNDASLHPDDSDSGKIDDLISRMLAEVSPDYPVTTEGFVRTLLYPCDFYQLPEERMLALREYALASGSEGYYVKLLTGSPWLYEPPDPSARNEVLPPSSEHLASFATHIEETWRRQSKALYWRGRWPPDDRLPDHSEFMEHVLLDDAGAWAFLFSDEDHGYLVSDTDTSRKILAAFRTSPGDELERYSSYVDEFSARLGDRAPEATESAQAILEHARAGAWE